MGGDMGEWLVVGTTATFVAVLLGVHTIVSLVLERRRVSRTLKALPTGELTVDELRRRALAIPAVDRLVRPVVERILTGVKRMASVTQLERFEDKLVLAGRPVGWDPARLAAIRLIGRLVVPPLLFVALQPTNLGQLQTVLVCLAAGVMMHMAPDVMLDGMIRRRQEQIQTALPDTIDLLTITVEAGLGFDAALDRVARTSGGPLGAELRQVVQDIQLGRPRSQALRGMSNRVGLPDVRTLTSSIIQSEQFGIAVGTVLRSQAEEVREKRRQRAEEQAQKVPVKILVPLVFFILPSVFVVIVGPGAIQIAEQF